MLVEGSQRYADALTDRHHAGPVAFATNDTIDRGVDIATLDALADRAPLLSVSDLVAGYGGTEVLHGVDLRIRAGQSLCLIGPNGAGKSTVLHAIYGFADIRHGTIVVDGDDITRQRASDKLRRAGIGYVLQDSSVFPDMTVEENLLMGGFLMEKPSEAKRAAEQVFEKYDRLARRRRHAAKVLSGGERRLLEIARALMMDPPIVLVDEPSIGLEPRSIDLVFEILDELKRVRGKTVIMVEQNAKKGLAFADIGYVLVSGRVVRAATGAELLEDSDVGRLFLGG
ncbi:MAG TPA: ABC transporter ATP-binding protein [Casimicrobiaceae bacterium]|jgi:branched-chain amino acid transport system ATP-binding protein